MLYHNILVWKKAHEFTLQIYLITKKYPKDELFGIVSQMRRASSSVPANIVEGNARRSNKEFAQFLVQARGSLSETQYFLELSKDLEYISKIEYESLTELSIEVAKMLNSLLTKVKSSSY
ncbi:MAG TPA: four helix bundle protein [Candidatus Methanoperedens sp.]|nr:four helix bundle protein [Candidatus Methanoperedens sp.]